MSEEPKTTAAKAALRKRINARRIRTTAVATASVLGVPVVLLQILSLSCNTLGLFCVAKSGVEQTATAPAVPEETPQARPLSPAPAESADATQAQTRPDAPPAPVAVAASPSAASASLAPAAAVPDKAWLGIRVEPVTESLARELFMPSAHGARVTYVAPSSPADSAGLKTGDVISTFDGRIVQTADELRLILDEADPQVNASVEVIRKGLHSFITVEFSSSASMEEPGLF